MGKINKKKDGEEKPYKNGRRNDDFEEENERFDEDMEEIEDEDFAEP